MSAIQKRMSSLQPYVIGIRYADGVAVVDAVFKDGWIVPTSDIIQIVKSEELEQYYMFYSEKEGIGIDELLDFAENVVSLNREREEKLQLLKNKVQELKDLFNKTPLNKLKGLKFTIGKNDLSADDLLGDDPLKNEELKANKPNNRKQLQKEEPIIEEKKVNNDENINQPKNTASVVNNTFRDIELPPKGQKIVLEDYSLPPELTEGECNCKEGEYCPKCIDKEDL